LIIIVEKGIKMKIDFETVKEITFEDISDYYINPLYDYICNWFDNENDKAGYIYRNLETDKLIFIENESVDSWYNGEGFSYEVDGYDVFSVEKTDLNGRPYYLISERPINKIKLID
jgi:hypothetical protein